jgi:uncharacterized metal-binding protein
LIFTCAGAAHAGQVANRAGVELMTEKEGKLFCVAAVAAEIPEKAERARNAKIRVAIDGCEDHCCRKLLEKAGLSAEVHIVVTNLGIEKAPKEPQMITDAKRTVGAVKEKLATLRAW